MNKFKRNMPKLSVSKFLLSLSLFALMVSNVGASGNLFYSTNSVTPINKAVPIVAFPTVYTQNVTVGVVQTVRASVYIDKSLTDLGPKDVGIIAYEGKIKINPFYAKIVGIDFNNTVISNNKCFKAYDLEIGSLKGEATFALYCHSRIEGSGPIVNVTYKGIKNTGRSKQLISLNDFKFNETSVNEVPGYITVTGGFTSSKSNFSS